MPKHVSGQAPGAQMKHILKKETKEIPFENMRKTMKKNVGHKKVRKVGRMARTMWRKYLAELYRRNQWLIWILDTDFGGPVDLDRAP